MICNRGTENVVVAINILRSYITYVPRKVASAMMRELHTSMMRMAGAQNQTCWLIKYLRYQDRYFNITVLLPCYVLGN